MIFVRLRQRFAAWLALLAMLAGALAPTLAQAALAGHDRAGWIEVCGATGMVWVLADEAASDSSLSSADSVASAPGADPAPGHDTSSHCPWCSLHGGAAGLPPQVWQGKLMPQDGGPPQAITRAALLAGIWAEAQARAPPLAA